jgi:putative ABC transport system permease protein
MSLDDVMLMPITIAQDITQSDMAFRIGVKAQSPEVIDTAKDKIKQLLIERHGSEDFTLLTQDQIIKMFSSFFDILNNTVSGIAGISLLVGGIGIMNIMLVSVTERTKEIGIRKAVGATNFNILFQFLVESSFISLIGGGIGVALSYLATHFLTSRVHLPTDITPFALILALGISIGVGVIFGLLPATKAARKNPIDALRYE